MVIAYHVTFSTYGFWLPNDPRGSNSSRLRNPSLAPFGPVSKVTHRRSVAHIPHDRALRAAAKRALTHPPVVLTGEQALCIANAFAEFSRKSQIAIHACAILPQHVHLVVARHRYHIEQIVNLLKGAASRKLRDEHKHPLSNLAEDGTTPSLWARGCRRVYLNTADDVLRCIHYVESNPLRDGKKPQHWSFTTPFHPA